MDESFLNVRQSLGWFLNERLAFVIRQGSEYQLEALVVAGELQEMLELAVETEEYIPALERVALAGPEFQRQMTYHAQRISGTRARVQMLTQQLEQLQNVAQEMRRLDGEEKELAASVQERIAAQQELEERRHDLERRKRLEAQQPNIRLIIESINAEAATLDEGIRTWEELRSTAHQFASLLERMQERIDQEVVEILVGFASSTAQLADAKAQSDLHNAELERIERETAEYSTETEKVKTAIDAKAQHLEQARKLFYEQRVELDAHVLANKEVARALGISNPSGTLDEIETRLLEIGAMIAQTDRTLGDVLRKSQERAKADYQVLT